MKILMLDIETAPDLVYVWDLFKPIIGPKQVVEPRRIISWSAKWYNDGDVIFDSINESSEKSMLKSMHKLMDEADVIISYYGSEFDVPRLNTEFIKHGFAPPSPYKQVDLKRVVQNNFRLPSNKLEYVVKAFGVGEKKDVGDAWTHWKKCLAGDPHRSSVRCRVLQLPAKFPPGKALPPA